MVPASAPPRHLLIEPPGRVRAASATHDTPIGAAVEDVLGIDWPTLEALARTTQRADAVGGRVRLEPLLGEHGSITAVLATDEGPASPMVITTAPPSSSRFGRDLAGLVGRDPATRAAVDLALRFARTNLPVMITAEEGSGVDVLARAMHAASGQAAGPFVHVPLGTIVKSAVEQILFFGHPHSSAHGMLFVEDVQELGLEQGRRLAQSIDRGSLAETHFVCSAPPDVRDRVTRGEIARELLALVRGTTVALPPLREREDFSSLVTRALEDLGREGGRVTPAALAALEAYGWPRNHAELWACLEHAAVVAGGDREIDLEHLPHGIFQRQPEQSSGGLRRSAERAALEEALRSCAGNVSAAAKRLGVARSTLYRLLKRHGMDR